MGKNPDAGLIQATSGYLYGTTYNGGANSHGTVFNMSPAGTLTTLYSFCALEACADGASPRAGVIAASNGELYGTTEFGGANALDGAIPYGTVYTITLAGSLTTPYSFCAQSGCTDAPRPSGDWFRPPMGTSMGPLLPAGRTAWTSTVVARSSKSPHTAR